MKPRELSTGREWQVLLAFVVPYVIALPIFRWEDIMYGADPEVLLPKESATIGWTMLIGLVGVLWARRDWLSRIAFGFVYLFVTFGAFVYWGLSSRGYYGRYW